ncbi:MAG: pitrilysin family protein [Gemmatimonadales bacterium]
MLVERHATAPVVAVVTHVRAGYFDEPDEWVGIAHVLEHMFFKGTPRHGPGALARETQLLGGYINAGTIYDKTVYYAVAPSAGGGLARIAALQADALRHLSLDESQLARELEVIVQEARRKLDNPGAVTVESLYAELYRRHRMGRWRIGTPEQLRQLTAADLRAYYRSRYVPERVIVSLVGDLDPEAAVALAERTWGDWTADASTVEPSPEEPPGRPGTLKITTGDVARPMAAFGWRTVGALHDDTPALDVAADVLSSGRSAWLDRQVRDTGLAAAIGAGHSTPGEVGVFDVTLTGSPATLRQAVRRAMDAVRTLHELGPSVDDLARVRALNRTRWARRLEAAEGRATALAEFEALGGYQGLNVYLDRIAHVDVDQVRRAAATWLSDGPSGSLYLPRDLSWDEHDWPPHA